MARRAVFPQIDSIQQFRQCLLASLSKFGDSYTQKTAWDEVKELMTDHITNTDRMNLFLYTISEQNEHMKSSQKKEHIKLYGLAGEIFEDSLLPFIPKILNYLQKKLKEGDQHMHVPVSDSLGILVHHVLKKVPTMDDCVENLSSILRLVFQNL